MGSAWRKPKWYYDYFSNQGRAERASYKALHRVRESIPHPNVLPIIDVSETQFPFCFVSPWMPDGNITQYTQTNLGTNRLMLVRTHQLEA
jgi:hypothetical protein